jgi:hypothetical protein
LAQAVGELGEVALEIGEIERHCCRAGSHGRMRRRALRDWFDRTERRGCGEAFSTPRQIPGRSQPVVGDPLIGSIRAPAADGSQGLTGDARDTGCPVGETLARLTMVMTMVIFAMAIAAMARL